jgi:hypothetical protein
MSGKTFAYITLPIFNIVALATLPFTAVKLLRQTRHRSYHQFFLYHAIFIYSYAFALHFSERILM